MVSLAHYCLIFQCVRLCRPPNLVVRHTHIQTARCGCRFSRMLPQRSSGAHEQANVNRHKKRSGDNLLPSSSLSLCTQSQHSESVHTIRQMRFPCDEQVGMQGRSAIASPTEISVRFLKLEVSAGRSAGEKAHFGTLYLTISSRSFLLCTIS